MFLVDGMVKIVYEIFCPPYQALNAGKCFHRGATAAAVTGDYGLMLTGPLLPCLTSNFGHWIRAEWALSNGATPVERLPSCQNRLPGETHTDQGTTFVGLNNCSERGFPQSKISMFAPATSPILVGIVQFFDTGLRLAIITFLHQLQRLEGLCVTRRHTGLALQLRNWIVVLWLGQEIHFEKSHRQRQLRLLENIIARCRVLLLINRIADTGCVRQSHSNR